MKETTICGYCMGEGCGLCLGQGTLGGRAERERRDKLADAMRPLPFDRRAKAENGCLRRIRIDLHTPAEKAIRDAVIAVEALGAHVWLTDAVILLGKAQDRVADYIDERINV